MMSTVGILGGTGPAGRGVAARLAATGRDVFVGSRDAQRAADVVASMDGPRSGSIRGVTNEEAASCDLVIVATPWESTIATVSALREALANKVVVTMVNAMVREGRELVPLTLPRGSMAGQLAAALPASVIVGAFHHLPAAQMEDLGSDLDADVIVVGDKADARDAVAQVITAMPGLRAVVAGSLALAGAVEAFTAVCVSINMRHRAHSYVRLEGLAQ